MRLELALLVGIVIFCSWCAYIVARMNASVSSGGNAAAIELAINGQESLMSQHPQPQLGSDYLTSVSANDTFRSMAPSSSDQRIRNTAANYFYPHAAYEQAATSQQQQQQQLPYAVAVQQGVWPNVIHRPILWPQQISTQDDLVDASEETEDSSTTPSDESQPQSQSGHQEATTEEPAGELQDGGVDEDDEHNDNNDNRVDEVARRSSFSELVDDERERDRDGRLVVKRRRHLLNGHPVQRPTSARDDDEDDEDQSALEERQKDEEDEEEEQPQERSTNAHDEKQRDFDQLVAEIDRERQDRKELAKKTQEKPAQMSRRSDEPEQSPIKRAKTNLFVKDQQIEKNKQESMSKKKGTKVVKSSKLDKPIKAKDSHEHRLHETIEQQQWDDDSAGQPADLSIGKRKLNSAIATKASDTRNANKHNAPNEARLNDRTSIVDTDAEARQLELLANDLMFGPEQQPVRRKRWTSEEDQKWRLRRNLTSFIPQLQLSSSPSSDSVKLKSDRVDKAEAVKDEWLASEAEANLDNKTIRGINDDSARAFVHKKSERHQLNGLEAINVEVLANPAPSVVSANGAAVRSEQSVWPPTSVMMTTTANGPTQGVANTLPPILIQLDQNGGRLPVSQVAHLASGSHKKSSKMKKKIKKKSKKKKKSSKSSKFNSDKKLKQEKKSKKKIGNVVKKKKKAEKNHVEANKHFKGMTRGKKLAGGHGHKGANKHQKYHKDKGYKKRGFKKSYHKLETGDHKTYFDEFRDKDHNNKWKKIDDKHKYSQSKRWSGSDMNKMKRLKLKEKKLKASKVGKFHERAKSSHTKKLKEK